MVEDRYLSAQELAQMLNLKRGTIYVMSRKGILPKGAKIGTVRRWNLNEIQAFLKEAK